MISRLWRGWNLGGKEITVREGEGEGRYVIHVEGEEGREVFVRTTQSSRMIQTMESQLTS